MTIRSLPRFPAPVIALALVLLACPPLEAGPPTDTLRDVFGQADQILATHGRETEPTETLAAMRVLLSGLFEFRDAAALTLGRQWQDRTSAEREEFTRLFTELVEFSYLQMVATMTYRRSRVNVRYLGEAVDRDAATVRTALVGNKRGNVLLDYEMARQDDRWAVRDVLIEGISLVANYRAQFHRIIQESSYPELVARMKAKTGDWSRMSSMATEANGTSQTLGGRNPAGSPASPGPSQAP
jgi:phospholipid transport system substrate-binding protein